MSDQSPPSEHDQLAWCVERIEKLEKENDRLWRELESRKIMFRDGEKFIESLGEG
jgi:uncharacterized protein (UPF0335 family)